MRITSAKTVAATVCSVALLSAVGCASEDEGSADSGGSDSGNSSSDGGTEESPSEDMASEEPSEDAPDMAAQLVGPGCADYAKAVPDGAGSVEGMAQDPVATAASNNPLLKTLVAAVSGKLNPDVNLVDTLNQGEFTVFAPVDEAFAQLPKKTVMDLAKPANAKMLETILTYHVVEGQIAPDQITGEQATVQGGTVQVTGEGDSLKVNDASVICGGVQTANATVYLIDGVLTPEM